MKSNLIHSAFVLASALLSASAHADYVYSTTASSILRLDVSSGTVTTFADSLNLPIGVAIDKSGNIYTSTYNDNKIVRFGPGGGSPVVFASFGVNAEQMAFDSQGNLYAPLPNSNSVMKITPSGTASLFATANLSTPAGVAFDAAGNLYVANAGNGTVAKVTPGGVSTVFVTTSQLHPQDVKLDSAGNVYVSEFNDFSSSAGVIQKFTPAGIGSVFYSSTSFPVGLAFDASNNLYALRNGAGAVKIFPNGSSMAIPGFGGTYLAYQVTAVPEVPTAPLALSGLLAIWLARRVIASPRGQTGLRA